MSARPLDTLLFGGCLVHAPIRKLGQGNAISLPRRYREIRQIHSFGEMFQLVEILRGQKTVPQELRPLCRMAAGLGAVPGAEDFNGIDVALVEPASPMELTFRGVSVNRNGIKHVVLDPLAEQGRDVERLGARWLRVGLIGLDRDVRDATTAKLLEYIREDAPDAELQRAVLLETEAFKSDIPGGFRKMQELLGCPIGAVAYVFRYMPDGRPISWPAGFREEVLKAAGDLGLPIFDPAPLVCEFGVEKALTPDWRHYSDAFLPVAGGRLAEFVEEVYRHSRAGSNASPLPLAPTA